MIVGNGDVASVLRDRPGAIFFASGVSNSLCESKDIYKREKDLLLSQDKNACLFYFSTISIYYKDSAYTRHKRMMERLIKSNWNHYNIIRIGNITWGKNPNTFLNYIKRKKEAGEDIELVDEYRYLIDKDQLRAVTDHLPLKGQNELCVFSKMGKVKDLI
jgi:hypothetical protein